MDILKMNEEHLNYLKSNLNDFDEFWNVQILEDEFENENSEYFVLISGEKIVGFTGLWFNLDEAHIMNIAIKNKERKKGFGTILLEFLVNEARKKEKECITLEVREDNLAAIRLYKKMNFRELGRRKKYYGQFDAIIMTKFFNT